MEKFISIKEKDMKNLLLFMREVFFTYDTELASIINIDNIEDKNVRDIIKVARSFMAGWLSRFYQKGLNTRNLIKATIEGGSNIWCDNFNEKELAESYIDRYKMAVKNFKFQNGYLESDDLFGPIITREVFERIFPKFKPIVDPTIVENPITFFNDGTMDKLITEDMECRGLSPYNKTYRKFNLAIKPIGKFELKFELIATDADVCEERKSSYTYILDRNFLGDNLYGQIMSGKYNFKPSKKNSKFDYTLWRKEGLENEDIRTVSKKAMDLRKKDEYNIDVHIKIS